MTIRSTVREAAAAGVAIVSSSFKEFALACKAAGFDKYAEWLNPKTGKVPTIAFIHKDDVNRSVCVVLSKGVAALMAAGKLPADALKTLQVVDGKNAAGEARYYLSSNGVNMLSVDQAIAIGEAYLAKVSALNDKKIADLIS